MYMPTHGTLSTLLTVGMTTLGAVITVGTTHGGGIALIIGIIVAMILGGVGTDITTQITTMLGTLIMEVGITTTTFPHALHPVAPLQATEVTVPARSVAHDLPQTDAPAKTATA